MTSAMDGVTSDTIMETSMWGTSSSERLMGRASTSGWKALKSMMESGQKGPDTGMESGRS